MADAKKLVVIIEDDDDLRKSFEVIINESDNFKVIGSFGNFEDAFRDIGELMPDIVLMDIDLPGKNGIEGVRILNEVYPSIESIMVTVFEDYDMVFNALKAGASGFITKIGNVELIDALEEIVRGGAPMSRRIARMLVNNYHLSLNFPITTREKQILNMLAVGKTYSQIAEELHISRETSKTHIRNIYSKLQVNSKSDAIAKASRERLI